MIRISKTFLLMGAAVLALNACAGDKGPGKIGSKDDIVVRNNGLPGAQASAPEQAAAAPAIQGGDFSTTVEQGQAVPAPEVAAAEPVVAPENAITANEPMPDNSPAMQVAVEQHEAAKAPVPSTTDATPPNQSTAPVSETRPLDAMAPTTPVHETVRPPSADASMAAAPSSAPAATGGIYPAADYPAPAPTPAVAPTPAAAPVPVPAKSPTPSAKYPLDPNAPYSPKAVAEAAAEAGTPVTEPEISPAGINLSDPAIIRATQAALAGKGGYVGAQTGIMDAELLNALTIYQGKNGLPQGGINEATLMQLGIIK